MVVVRYPDVIDLADLYDIDPLAVEYFSSFKNRAAKVVEFVGLLLGFIVVAVVDARFDSYADVFNYLAVGFFIALFCLFMSVFLGLFAYLHDDARYVLSESEFHKAVSTLVICLRLSVIFCYLGLFSVISIVLVLVFKSLLAVVTFAIFCIISIFIICCFILLYPYSLKR